MANMEKLHSEALAVKEEEMKEKINKAVVGAKCFPLFSLAKKTTVSNKKNITLIFVFFLKCCLGAVQRGVCTAG